jgi:hypothetical protein
MSTTTPVYLRWSESLITFDWMNDSDCVPKPGRFPVIVDLLIGTTWLTKAVVDGGSDLNLKYLNTFEGLGLGWDLLKASSHPFYGVVPGKRSIPVGQINLPIIFRDASNYHTETLTFEVVDFSRPYHIILGQLCYVKFMAIPSYAYLKLKIPGSTGIITVEAKAKRELDCEQDNIELVAGMVATAEL